MNPMDPARLHCVLDVAGGPSRRVGPGGVLIGRQRDCDIVSSDPTASRRHALVRLTAEGAEVVPLGRTPIEVNGAAVDQPRALTDGDRIAVPGLELAVAISVPAPELDPRSGVALALGRGGRFGLGHTPFLVGGGAEDDLIIKRWPARTLALHLAQGGVFVEVCEGTATRNGAAIAPGEQAVLAIGDRLDCRGETLELVAVNDAVTTAVRGDELPRRIELELLPRGGRVVFTTGALARPVYLADRRFDLVLALARPPGGRVGELVSDDALRAAVWPRKPEVTRQEINMLISRCRRDLLDAGLAGPRLIERAQGGGATRLVVAPDAEIVMKG